MENDKVKNRLDEISKFLDSSLCYYDWMKNKFIQNPNLMNFKLEKVPELITRGVNESNLENIDKNEIKKIQLSLDRFAFILPFKITTHDTNGWGDPFTTKGKLYFNIGYLNEDKLDINASYNTAGMMVFDCSYYDLRNFETVIVDYVKAICNYLATHKLIKKAV